MNHSEEIKSKLDIVDTISGYINLKAVGSNFRAICPFHNEKTPSLMVSPDKQIWHCFGCGKGGDLITFVMEMEGLDFVEALKLLAPRAGVILENKDFSNNSQKDKLLQIMELSRKYFNFILTSDKNNSENTKKIREYLSKRGLKAEAIERWQIGYSLDNYEDLIKFLKTKKFNDNEILLAGMSFKSDKGKYFNRFRDRIMFPINDVNGRTVAFTARINPETKDDRGLGKYINSPQTEIYDKSRLLFGLDKAKTAVKEKDELILVEGQMDAITAFEAGFKNISAVSGTALTISQLNLIKRYTKNIVLAFDHDKAGANATDRGISEALKQGFNIRIAILKNGKDPDEIIKNNPADFSQMIKTAPNIMDYYLITEFEGIDLNNISEKNKVVTKILNVINKLYNKVEQDFWLKELSQKARVDEIFLREELNKISKNIEKNDKVINKKNINEVSLINDMTREDKLVENLLSLLLKLDDYFEYVFNNLNFDFLLGKYREFYNYWLIYYNKNKEIKYQALMDYFIKENKPEFVELLKTIGLHSEFYWSEEDFSELAGKEELAKSILEIKRNYYKESIKKCQNELIKAEKDNNDTIILEIMEKLKHFNEELKKIM
ncbi:MAG TPA: DNA primase [bacterium]|nr:DNA primase [bacterium]